MIAFEKNEQTFRRHIVSMVLVAWVVVFAGWEAQARQGYLKVVGPAPLRFEPAYTNTLMMLKAVMQIPKLAVTESTNGVMTNVAMLATNQGAGNGTMEINKMASGPRPVPEVDAVTNQAVAVDSGNPTGVEGVNNISVGGSSSARDMLPVTPSMITQYLKPTQSQVANQADQPGATVFVPMQMGFTPPTTQGAGNVPESRAVYNSR